jgi:phosphoribosylanthranilate isomerase
MWVKICGITTPGDAAAAVRAGADAIGLNFHPASKRFVTPVIAADLAPSAMQADRTRPVEIVGVFVNAPVADILEAAAVAQLTTIQFHGDESPADVLAVHVALPGRTLIRAVRLSESRVDECRRLVADTAAVVPLEAVLVDAWTADAFGGTGQSLPAGLVKDFAAALNHRVILAGGLTPQNIAARIASEQPWGVDTASGVEQSPGIKSETLVRQFIERAKAARRAISNPGFPV